MSAESLIEDAELSSRQVVEPIHYTEVDHDGTKVEILVYESYSPPGEDLGLLKGGIMVALRTAVWADGKPSSDLIMNSGIWRPIQ